MIVHLIIACEIMFWVFIAAGLAARYLLRRKTLGAALLICAPLVDVVLLVATALDLRGGGEANFTHGLAAAYIGFSVAFGHSLISWADARFAYRFAGGPAPVAPPKYGECASTARMARVRQSRDRLGRRVRTSRRGHLPRRRPHPYWSPRRMDQQADSGTRNLGSNRPELHGVSQA